MNPYKCDKHKLDFACLGCIKAWINRHDRMLELLKKIADVNSIYGHRVGSAISTEARELLEEIGKLK